MGSSAVIGRARAAYVALVAVVAGIVLVVGLVAGLGLIWAILAGLVLGLAAGAAIYLTADSKALSALGAQPLAASTYPRLENLIDGLTVAHGFRSPALYVIDDAAPNAAVVGRTPQHSSLILTTGLLERLERVELEGVLAHELTRIRSRQTFVNVTVATLVGRPLGFADGFATWLAGHLVSPDTPVLTDLAGASITRYPPGLAGALVSMRKDGRVVKSNPRAYRHLWLNVPDSPIIEQTFTLDDRIAVLQEL
jgi:heat shock protein HtpX